MATYYYQFKYDKETNDFHGLVESVGGNVVFQIHDIVEIRALIEKKYMNHIDDNQGLELYLKSKKVLDQYDTLFFLGLVK